MVCEHSTDVAPSSNMVCTEATGTTCDDAVRNRIRGTGAATFVAEQSSLLRLFLPFLPWRRSRRMRNVRGWWKYKLRVWQPYWRCQKVRCLSFDSTSADALTGVGKRGTSKNFTRCWSQRQVHLPEYVHVAPRIVLVETTVPSTYFNNCSCCDSVRFKNASHSRCCKTSKTLSSELQDRKFE